MLVGVHYICWLLNYPLNGSCLLFEQLEPGFFSEGRIGFTLPLLS